MLRKMLDNQAQTAQNIGGGGGKRTGLPTQPNYWGGNCPPCPPFFAPDFFDVSELRWHRSMWHVHHVCVIHVSEVRTLSVKECRHLLMNATVALPASECNHGHVSFT
jgi:hypothetical protein